MCKPNKTTVTLSWTRAFTSFTLLLVSEPLEGKNWILVITVSPEPAQCQHTEGVYFMFKSWTRTCFHESCSLVLWFFLGPSQSGWVSLQPASHQSFGHFWAYGIQDSRAQHSRLNFELVAFRTKITWVQGYGHRATVLLKSYFFILSFIEEGMCFFKLLTYFLQKKV